MFTHPTIAETCARIDRWYGSLAAPAPTCFTCEELCNALGAPMRSLHLPLLLLRWDCRQCWGRDPAGKRVLRVMWAPPGHRVPPPPRGRPSPDLRPIIAALVGTGRPATLAPSELELALEALDA